MVVLQLLDSNDCMIWTKFLEIFFYFFVPGAQSNKRLQNLTGSNMTGNYQTSTIHNIIKFENCHLAELNSIKNCNKTIDFFHFILATVDKYQ